MKSSVNNDVLYKIHIEASLGASDVSNSLDKSRVLLGLVFGKVTFVQKLCLYRHPSTCQTSGKPSTRFPLERLVEQEPNLIYFL